MVQKSSFWLANAVVLEVDTDRVSLREVANISGVRRIHDNVEVEPFEPGQSSRTSQTVDSDGVESSDHGEHTYGLEQIDVPAVWDEHDTGSGAKVAVLDTGIDPDHETLDLFTEDPDDPTYPGGWAEFDEDGNAIEGSEPHESHDGSHGTHVSGTVAGGDESSRGHIGVAPDVDLLHGLVLPGGNGSWDQIIGGMQWAADNGADIINLSLGSEGEHSAYDDAIAHADAEGVLTIGSAGNDSEEFEEYGPGSQCHLAVSAIDTDEELASFSNYGEYVDITALGVSGVTTFPADHEDGGKEDEYSWFGGTSMSAPVVAGVAGLVLSVDDSLTVEELTQTLTETATDIGLDELEQGAGRVDAAAAVEAIADTPEDTTVSGTGDTIAPETEATISVEATLVDEVVIDGLWTDCPVSVDGVSEEYYELSEVGDKSQLTIDWSETATTPNYSLSFTPPANYQSGEYLMKIDATGSEGTDTDEVVLEITD